MDGLLTNQYSILNKQAKVRECGDVCMRCQPCLRVYVRVNLAGTLTWVLQQTLQHPMTSVEEVCDFPRHVLVWCLA